MSSATAAPAKKQEKNETMSVLRSVANNARQYGIVGALLVIVLVFEILTRGVLLKPNSFVSLIQQNAYVIILAIGMVMVIIATHIDLSVGSLVAFIGGVCDWLLSSLCWSVWSSAAGKVSGLLMWESQASLPLWLVCSCSVVSQQ